MAESTDDSPTRAARRRRFAALLLPPGAAALGAAAAPGGWAWLGAGAAGLAAAMVSRAWHSRSDIESPETSGEPTEAPREESIPGLDFLAEVPMAVLLMDADGVVRFATHSAETLLERPVTGQHIARVFRAPSVVTAVEEAISGDQDDRFEFRVRRPRDMTLTATVRPLHTGAAGDPAAARVLLALDDNTGRSRIEATRSDFIANASHELRTPLTAIGGIVETLRGPARDDPAAREQFLEIIAKQTGRMSRLVDDLLSLSRVELQENVAPTEAQDLRGILAEVQSAMRPMAEQHGLSIRDDLPDTLPPVNGSRDELAQVFVNLVDNAIRYGGAGVGLRAAAAEDRVEVEVFDSGPGIDGHHIPRLTERFYRVDPGDSRARGGTGLGLAIVKHIVNRHRGTLRIESAPGQGSRFIVSFPAGGLPKPEI